MSRVVQTRVGTASDALDRFEDTWNRAAAGGAGEPLYAVLFSDLPALLANLTLRRWQMLERLRAEGPMTIFALARRVGRNYKNVHGDVARFVQLGLIERRRDGLVAVPWDAVRAELRLGA
jgi:predicted transcriptional regulator